MFVVWAVQYVLGTLERMSMTYHFGSIFPGRLDTYRLHVPRFTVKYHGDRSFRTRPDFLLVALVNCPVLHLERDASTDKD